MAVTIENGSEETLDDSTLSIPLPAGIDQWTASVRVDGGTWSPYPANGLLPLDPIPGSGATTIEIRGSVEQGAPAWLGVTAQLLGGTGVLADVVADCNVLPTVDAGPDTMIDLGTSISLSDASASDGGGALTGISWTDHGAGGTFDDAKSLHATYTPPAASGVVELTLSVTDEDGGESHDSLRVRVNAVPDVDAGGDRCAAEGEPIDLGTAAVTDSDGWIRDLTWSDGGAGGTFVPSADSLHPTYVVPEVGGCGNEQVTLSLTATDNWGASNIDTLVLTVENVNSPPTVSVPDGWDVEAGQTVELSAVASDDDGWIEEIAWEQIGGIAVHLFATNQGRCATFDAPDADTAATLRFRFTAVDNCGDVATGEVPITVLPSGVHDTPSGAGALFVTMDVLDDRGLPLSPFDAPTSGDVVTVRVSVLNGGSVRIEDLAATLSGGIPVGLTSSTLDPWDRAAGTSDWPVLLDDPSGRLEIVATASGTDVYGHPISGSDSFRFLDASSAQGGALDLQVTGVVNSSGAGETITYAYRVINVGNVDLTGIALQDDRLGRIDLPTSARPGEELETQVVYTVRATDLPGPLVTHVSVVGFTEEGERAEATTELSVELAGDAGGGGFVSLRPRKLVISEIAWAGASTDAAAEWIELANIGEASVDLSGWRLSWYEKTGDVPSQSQWHTVELSGIVPPVDPTVLGDVSPEFLPLENGLWAVQDPRWPASGTAPGFFIMERGSDDVIANVSADLVYGEAFDSAFDLPDSGAVIYLLDPDGAIIDSANAQHTDRPGWPGGSASSHATMERIRLDQGDFDANWETTPGLQTYGVDASGRGLLATAGRPNSIPLEATIDSAAGAVLPSRAGEAISVSVPVSSVSRPGITVSSSSGSAAGGGGSVELPEISTLRAQGMLEISADLEFVPVGDYFIWIAFGDGETLLLPLRK